MSERLKPGKWLLAAISLAAWVLLLLVSPFIGTMASGLVLTIPVILNAFFLLPKAGWAIGLMAALSLPLYSLIANRSAAGAPLQPFPEWFALLSLPLAGLAAAWTSGKISSLKAETKRQLEFRQRMPAGAGLFLPSRENSDDYIVSEANPALERILRPGCPGLIGQPLSVLLSAYPESRRNLAEIFSQTMENGAVVSKEMTIGAGSRRISLSAFPCDGTGISVLAEDITEREMKSRFYRESEEKLRMISENLQDLICLLDPTGRLFYLTPSVRKMLGYSTERMFGTVPVRLIHPVDRSLAIRMFRNAKARNISEALFRVKKQDGSWVWLDTRMKPILNSDGVITSLQSASRDVTESVLTRKKLEDSERKLVGLLDELQRSNEELKKMSITDSLTGLYNRRYIEYVLDVEFEKSRRYGNALCCMMIDIDHFKRFNDTWGHQAGDAILKAIAQAIHDHSRKVDICGRYGGEEFIILVNQSLDEAIAFAEKLLQLARDLRVMHEGKEMRLTISIGLTGYEGGMKTMDQLVKRADDALYLAKNNGRDRLEVYLLRSGA